MAANVNPRFTKEANYGRANITAANTKSDGSGTIDTDMFKVFTGDPTNGSLLRFIRVYAVASAVGTATNATSVRVYLSSVGNSGSPTTSADTDLIYEGSLPSVTADSATVPTNANDIPLGIEVPAGKYVLMSIGTAPAVNTSWRATAWGGNY